MIALAMLAGALILLAGILAGRFMPGRRRVPRLPDPPKPVCGCTHHYSAHDPKADMQCTVGIYVNGKHRGRCACARYAGPVPLPEYYAPEIAREAGE